MSRHVKGRASKGSQHWLQTIINGQPTLLDAQVGLAPILWRSPLADDDYAEYSDQAFLERLGVAARRRSLLSFWPHGGPHWDALGVGPTGEAVLVEAKSHVNELYSDSMAVADASIAQIQLALRETARHLGVAGGFDWSKQFYQYANRLAHAYFLQELNGIPTNLVFVYFIGDIEVAGPGSRQEWLNAIDVVHGALGLHSSPPFVKDVFLDVTEFATATT